MNMDDLQIDVLLDFKTALNKEPECEGIGVLHIENPCCKDRSVIIMKDTREGEPLYFAQCACGNTRTAGYKSEWGALCAWQAHKTGVQPNVHITIKSAWF